MTLDSILPSLVALAAWLSAGVEKGDKPVLVTATNHRSYLGLCLCCPAHGDGEP